MMCLVHVSQLISAVSIILLGSKAHGSNVDFRVTPAIVNPLTSTNVTLTCSVGTGYHNHFYHSGKEVSWIQIVKNKQERWHVLAQMSALLPRHVEIVNNSVTESYGAMNVKDSRSGTLSSYLKLVWAQADMEVFGDYRCDVIGMPDGSEGTIYSSTSSLKIGDALDSLAILRLFTHEKEVITKRLNKLVHAHHMADNQTSHLESRVLENEKRTLASLTTLESQLQEQVSKLQQMKSDMKTYIEELRNELGNRSEVIDANIKLLMDSGFLMIWPRGSYGLLQPSSGCPSQGAISGWLEGWLRMHTESSDRNRDEISTNSHLRGSAMTRHMRQNFITQHFCVKSDVNSTGPIWPNGSYCINKNGNCPLGFSQGSLIWDEEDDNANVTRSWGGTLPDNTIGRNSELLFCCRRDNSPDMAIFLPKGDPFYLYRCGGKCQQVYGMKVTEELIHFDTENDKNSDVRAGLHPDAGIDDIRLELCYYES
ncbi:unnamed protein product [Lymnaea stagnalis]|uniref:Apextrin C-terminal domain-containing protein n=1 Tax=Lymnaea stagnalis TaxID=6523 RepID=A0AAV2IA42_LYMST